jgi:hypothetical protein
MNRLPKVLQTEIWEYVRGDRAFFKSQFQIVMTELSLMDPQKHLSRAKMLQDESQFGQEVWVGGIDHSRFSRWCVRLTKRCDVGWRVETHDASGKYSSSRFQFEDARAEFHRQLVIAVTKTANLR